MRLFVNHQRIFRNVVFKRSFCCSLTPRYATLVTNKNVIPSSKHGICYGKGNRKFSTDTGNGNLSIDHVRDIIRTEGSRVVVMAGAGISTASGLPDFRSPGTGLYDNLQKYNLPYPEAVFDIYYFKHKPEPFFKLAQELYPSGRLKPNVAHYFVRLLYEKKLLLRMYTQNIDGFERMAGVPERKLVEAHGTFATATCQRCRKDYTAKQIEDSVLKGEVAYCKEDNCNGVVKPDIVFFGQSLPEKFMMFEEDLPRADLLLIMGTSLEVQPFASIANATRSDTPRVLFNMYTAENFYRNSPRDLMVLGDVVETLSDFCESLGWTDELKQLMNGSSKNEQSS